MPDLYEQIRDASQKAGSKAEAVAAYQSLFPGLGRGGWRQRIVSELAPIANMSPKNLGRRFDPSRLENVPRTQRERAQYEQLPVAPPEGGYHISGTIWFRYMDNPCESREVDEYISGEDAEDLFSMAMRDGRLAAVQGVINHYMTGGESTHSGTVNIAEPMLAASAQCPPDELSVEPID